MAGEPMALSTAWMGVTACTLIPIFADYAALTLRPAIASTLRAPGRLREAAGARRIHRGGLFECLAKFGRDSTS